MRENRIISIPIKDVVGAQAPKGEQVLFQYQKTVAADKKDTRQKVTLSIIEKPNLGLFAREAILRGEAKDASIQDLSVVIGEFQCMEGDKEKVEELKRIRRGKAIKFLRERRGISQKYLA